MDQHECRPLLSGQQHCARYRRKRGHVVHGSKPGIAIGSGDEERAERFEFGESRREGEGVDGALDVGAESVGSAVVREV